MEYGVNMFLSRYQILQQTDIKNWAKNQKDFNKSNPCNLYMILKRPRMTINPEYLFFNDEYIELEYFILDKEQKLERRFRMPKSKELDGLKLYTEYPYSTGRIESENKDRFNFKISALVDVIQRQDPIVEPLLDYEVLYVGQSFGNNGSRSAIDRLYSHSTLQKIYSEVSEENPNESIWLMLCSFTERSIGNFKFDQNKPIYDTESHQSKFINFLDTNKVNFSEKQKVNFTEAALINMFQPRYNKEFKNIFPDKKHKSYDECYRTKVNGIFIELDTTQINRWVYTKAKPRTTDQKFTMPYWQHSEFHFVDGKDRYKMFNNEYISGD